MKILKLWLSEANKESFFIAGKTVVPVGSFFPSPLERPLSCSPAAKGARGWAREGRGMSAISGANSVPTTMSGGQVQNQLLMVLKATVPSSEQLRPLTIPGTTPWS